MTNHIKFEDINPSHNLYIITQPAANGEVIIKFGTVKYSTAKSSFRPLNERIKDYLKYCPSTKVIYTGYRKDCELLESYIHRRYPSILMNEWYLPSMIDKIIDMIENKPEVTQDELNEQKKASADRLNKIAALFADVYKGINPTFKDLLMSHYESYEYDQDVITFEKWLTYQTGNDPMNEWIVNGFKAPSIYFNHLRQSCNQAEEARKESALKDKKKEYGIYKSLQKEYDASVDLLIGMQGQLDEIYHNNRMRRKLYNDLSNPIINPDTSTWELPKRFYFYDTQVQSFRLDIAYVNYLRDNVKGNESISLFRNSVIDYSLVDNYKYDDSLYIYYHPYERYTGDIEVKGGWVLCKGGLGELKKNDDTELRRIIDTFLLEGEEGSDDYNYYRNIEKERDNDSLTGYKKEHYTNDRHKPNIFEEGGALVESDKAAIQNIDPKLIEEMDDFYEEPSVKNLKAAISDAQKDKAIKLDALKEYKAAHQDNDWINKK